MKIPCEFCGKPCAKGGAMQYHIYRKHQADVRERFRVTLLLEHPDIYCEVMPKQIAERSVTPCWICGGDREIIGPFGESLEPCPHCVLMVPCEPIIAWLQA